MITTAQGIILYGFIIPVIMYIILDLLEGHFKRIRAYKKKVRTQEKMIKELQYQNRMLRLQNGY